MTVDHERKWKWKPETSSTAEDGTQLYATVCTVVCSLQVKLAKPQPTTTTVNNNEDDKQLALPGSDNSVTSLHLQSGHPEYIRAGDDDAASRVLCRWQFNISGYEPSEVNVKVDAGKLLVSARHADVKDADNSSSRQLNKQTDIPRDVIHEEMTSYMTSDGVLVVQAPVAGEPRLLCNATPQKSEVKTPAVDDDSNELECHFRPIELPPEQPPSNDVISASRQHIVKTGSDAAAATTTSLLRRFCYFLIRHKVSHSKLYCCNRIIYLYGDGSTTF